MKKNKILIAYGTKYGSTSEIAEVIAEEVYRAGYLVEIKWINNIHDIDCYAGIIIGAPIQYDKWMKDAVKFVDVFKEELKHTPVAYFLTCLTLIKNSQTSIDKAIKYTNIVFETNKQVIPVDVGAFAGVLNYKPMSFFQSFIAHIFYHFFKVKEGDYRNWKSIHKWAKQTITEMNIHLYT
jgi:menaquinone-dependent protoporphyrinogen oxidase